ncbi:uncharacterized protein LOC113470600 [Diaphorina citri]|uniref:Uncharacterized protein LOC113470600 n=1 Tax=Diaphorina citri TaxID=121845 RepID=A0A3Q0J8Y7_DIACI|nr:uncharacterized protein LOC113470600 [Diaphorina citri]KAI5720569.1 hypothetical protein M8J77_008852 [Diaphorina citri]
MPWDQDDTESVHSDVTILSLPFSDISQHKIGSINAVFDATHFSSTYDTVLKAIQEDHPGDRTKAPATLSQLFDQIEFKPTGVRDEVKEEIRGKLKDLKLQRKKIKERYEDEYKWRKEMAEQLIEGPDRMLWGRSLMNFDYSEFFVTPPSYHHFATRTPHWADRVEVGGAIREKARTKVTDWLDQYCD